MEESQELLRGSAVHWMAKVKEAVFAGNEDKDVKKIKTKYHNMKNSWKAAKKLQICAFSNLRIPSNLKCLTSSPLDEWTS